LILLTHRLRESEQASLDHQIANGLLGELSGATTLGASALIGWGVGDVAAAAVSKEYGELSRTFIELFFGSAVTSQEDITMASCFPPEGVFESSSLIHLLNTDQEYAAPLVAIGPEQVEAISTQLRSRFSALLGSNDSSSPLSFRILVNMGATVVCSASATVVLPFTVNAFRPGAFHIMRGSVTCTVTTQGPPRIARAQLSLQYSHLF
jgi:hypothetical protein